MAEAAVLLNEKDVATMIGMSVPWLRLRRQRKDGIPTVKLGRAVRYRKKDVEAWIDMMAEAA